MKEKDWTHEKLLELDGKSITCNIGGGYINDAKIRVEDDEIYVCQNIKEGPYCQNDLGYKYSWIISYDDAKYEESNQGCTEIKLKQEEQMMTVEDLKTGMVVEFRDGEKFLIMRGDFNSKVFGKQNLIGVNFDYFIAIGDHNLNLTDGHDEDCDIMRVYAPSISGFDYILESCNEETLIWKREDKYEYIENEIMELEEKIKQLKNKIMKLKK